MLKIIAIALLLLLFIGGGYAWYSMQSLPSWFDDTVETPHDPAVGDLLGEKVADVMNGEVDFSETEFNAIFVASLEKDVEGQKLLEVSDAVKAFLHEDKVELTAIINLDKVEAVNPNARRAVEKFDRIFPFIDGHRVALTVYGTPVVRDGSLGIRDDFYIKVGALPFSNKTLRGLGIEVERANTTNLRLKFLAIESMELRDQQVGFKVLPRF